jgi:hypothetical protein
MRIVTWNCCRGAFEAKPLRLGAYRADVTVVQECGRPEGERPDCLWMGDDPRHGLAVSAGSGWRVTPVEMPPGVPRYALPARISGRHGDVFMLGLWTLADRPHRYVKAAIRAVEMYRDQIDGKPAVLAGDFNSNAIWNRKTAWARDHKYLVAMLAEMGMVSAYHAFFGEEHGGEATPTFHLYHHESRPFHLDYCFVPVSWTVQAVSVGAYADWADASDHRPLVVDVTPPPCVGTRVSTGQGIGAA